eukprot:3292549-Rhodomonas_salina.2
MKKKGRQKYREIKHNKPPFQYRLYGDCAFLCLISGADFRRMRSDFADTVRNCETDQTQTRSWYSLHGEFRFLVFDFALEDDTVWRCHRPRCMCRWGAGGPFR